MVFRLAIPTPLPCGEAAQRLWSAEVHSRVIPLTTVTPAGRLDVAGHRFVARTGLGPLAVDDVMVVESVAGGRVRIRKTGRVLRGRVRAVIEPDGEGSVIRWEQDLRVRFVPQLAQPLVDAVARLAYGTTIRRILATPADDVAA